MIELCTYISEGECEIIVYYDVTAGRFRIQGFYQDWMRHYKKFMRIPVSGSTRHWDYVVRYFDEILSRYPAGEYTISSNRVRLPEPEQGKWDTWVAFVTQEGA